VAVIVPFRDLHEAQKRQEHLNRFIPEMQSFLESTGSPFEILIIEQSSDGRKFNRGKLLNIGFDLARKSGCQVFVLHDVDLLPSRELATWYTSLPSAPVHIARVWDRYSGNAKYFGGVVAFSSSMFMQINGFPNNFWGWGGEDDEMYQRVVEVRRQFVFQCLCVCVCGVVWCVCGHVLQGAYFDWTDARNTKSYMGKQYQPPANTPLLSF